METMAFLGCSRGLGRQVVKAFHRQMKIDFSLLVARNAKDLSSLASEIDGPHEILQSDFSQVDSMSEVLKRIKDNKIQRVFYFAGGGPYGSFASKEWKDHRWALQVSLLTPMKLLHHLIGETSFSNTKQIIFIGSQIADSSPDPGAASYATAKHGLKGLIDSVSLENPKQDIRLFRPGYMDTDMLPPQAKPRLEGKPIADPRQVAEQFVNWCLEN